MMNKFLGHSSLNISKKSNDKPCNICLHAKQTCDSFPLSENNASGIFKLIHCDLWGLYKDVSIAGTSFSNHIR